MKGEMTAYQSDEVALASRLSGGDLREKLTENQYSIDYLRDSAIIGLMAGQWRNDCMIPKIDPRQS